MTGEPIKATVSGYVEYASYTYTPKPKTKAEHHANKMLEALFGPKITQMYQELIEKAERK